MANEEQVAILMQGVDVWNKWRKEDPNLVIDLTSAYLEEAHLISVDLRGVDLREADLRKADLEGANLEGANLGGAYLRGAKLREANLTTAYLWGANLTGANLSGANLEGAELREADLREADLSGANLGKVDLRRADLGRAFLIGADLKQAILIGADLREAYLWGADLRGVDLREADLRGAELRGSKLEDFDLSGANLKGVDLSRVDLSHVNLKGVIIDTSNYPAADLSLEHCLNLSRDEVSFTAIYPKEAKVETWHTLLVYAHILSAIDEVHQDVQRFKDQIHGPKEVTSALSTPIARGTEITIAPYCDGVLFNPARVTVKWMERYHRADFRFRADKSLVDDAAKGQINIYVGPILVSTIRFAVLLNETGAPSDCEEQARMYRQEDIFASYSHKDTEIVVACKKAYEALGFNVLIDADTLRSGQVWNEELMRMIDRATIFQLFWSEYSCQSQYCRQEWEHALKRNEAGFIRPVYWKKPIPDVPDELSRYHFDYMELEKVASLSRSDDLLEA